jgi:hypothetical protein
MSISRSAGTDQQERRGLSPGTLGLGHCQQRGFLVTYRRLTKPSNDKPFLESDTTRRLRQYVHGDAEERVCESIIRSGFGGEKASEVQGNVLYSKLPADYSSTDDRVCRRETG